MSLLKISVQEKRLSNRTYDLWRC